MFNIIPAMVNHHKQQHADKNKPGNKLLNQSFLLFRFLMIFENASQTQAAQNRVASKV